MREPAGEEDILRLRALLSYQYGPEAGRVLDGRKIEVERSTATGRIRRIYVDGVFFGSIRASDGFILPSVEGGRLLLEVLPKGRYTVVVSREAVPFVAKGRTVFCKHVIDADPEIKAGDEVFVVDEDGRLLAVGRAVVSGTEMKKLRKGECVKNRKSVSS